MSAAETENLQSKIAGCWLGKNIGGTLAACRSEIFGFGKSMSIPIDA